MRLSPMLGLLVSMSAFGGVPVPTTLILCSVDEPAWFATVERRFGISWQVYTRHIQPMLCADGAEHRGHRATTGYIVVGDLDACASTDSDGLCITGTDDVGAP